MSKAHFDFHQALQLVEPGLWHLRHEKDRHSKSRRRTLLSLPLIFEGRSDPTGRQRERNPRCILMEVGRLGIDAPQHQIVYTIVAFAPARAKRPQRIVDSRKAIKQSAFLSLFH
jgi:hypothetical protein